MQTQDLKNLLENIYHLLAEEDVPPMLSPEDPNWSPLQPPPPWLSPLDPNPTPRVDPIVNPDGPGGGTIQDDPVSGRRFYVFPNGRVLIWSDSLGRWILFKYPMLGDPSLPFPNEIWPWWLGGERTPEGWLDLINRSPRFQAE